MLMLNSLIENVKERIANIKKLITQPLQLKKKRWYEEVILEQMGFNQQEIRRLIAYASHYQLLQESLGQLIWKTAKLEKLTPVEAGKRLSQGYYWHEWRLKITNTKTVKEKS